MVHISDLTFQISQDKYTEPEITNLYAYNVRVNDQITMTVRLAEFNIFLSFISNTNNSKTYFSRYAIFWPLKLLFYMLQLLIMQPGSVNH